MQWKGDQLWGTIEVLQTPSGMLLWELYSQVGCLSAVQSCSAADDQIAEMGEQMLAASTAWALLFASCLTA